MTPTENKIAVCGMKADTFSMDLALIRKVAVRNDGYVSGDGY